MFGYFYCVFALFDYYTVYLDVIDDTFHYPNSYLELPAAYIT